MIKGLIKWEGQRRRSRRCPVEREALFGTYCPPGNNHSATRSRTATLL